MELRPTALPGVMVIAPAIFRDDRGHFLEVWHRDRLREAGIEADFVQDNLSRSGGGVLRGLHYQVVQPQGKLVRAVCGSIYDVAVDLRRSSPMFGRWVGVELTDENQLALWVPPGFAHGFYVTSERADVVYKCSAPYAPALERTLRWDDSTVGVQWPLAAGAPRLSAKDAAGRSWVDAEYYP